MAGRLLVALIAVTTTHQVYGYLSNQVVLNAETWILKLRNSEQHWGNQSTALALLALSHSSTGSWNLTSIEGQLAVKQVDIDFLYDRVRKGDSEIYSDRLVSLAVTLTSLCRQPGNYYDYDLLDGMLDQRRYTNDFTFASEMLAVCGGDGNIRRTHIRRLIKLLNPKQWIDPSTDIDTMAMTIMAAGCVSQKYSHQTVLPLVNRIVPLLTLKQHPDGSFQQNIISTALAVQAFQVEGLSSIPEIEASRQKAEEWLYAVQNEDGSFNSDLLATVEVMLALSSKGGRSNISMSHCSTESEIPSTTADAQVIHTDRFIQIELLIWSVQQMKQTIEQSIPVGWTIYQALQKAQKDNNIMFETKEFSFGHYVTSINNITELDQSPGYRWMIYILPSKVPTENITPTQEFMLKTSVSSHQLKKGERVLFWYRQARY